MSEPRIILIYVPTATAPCRSVIPPGSAIVGGGALFNAQLVLDYEPPQVSSWNIGDEFGITTNRFSERVRIAVARYLSQYPTELRFRASRTDVMSVGMYLNHPSALEHNGVVTITDYMTLEGWLEEARSS